MANGNFVEKNYIFSCVGMARKPLEMLVLLRVGGAPRVLFVSAYFAALPSRKICCLKQLF
jgi:hypothetical protein